MSVEPVFDEYDALIPGLPVPGLIYMPFDKKLDRQLQDLLRRVRARKIAEYEARQAALAASGASGASGTSGASGDGPREEGAAST
jgi:hypothetical protein